MRDDVRGTLMRASSQTAKLNASLVQDMKIISVKELSHPKLKDVQIVAIGPWMAKDRESQYEPPHVSITSRRHNFVPRFLPIFSTISKGRSLSLNNS
jgi:hypothetical protein